MREIKFRVWNPTYGMMKPLDIWAMTSFRYDNLDGTKTLEKSYPPETVFLQFTGLKDENGEEIYEGDIITVEYNGIGKKTVQWDDEGKWNISCYSINRCSIIGNIYEHKHLLK